MYIYIYIHRYLYTIIHYILLISYDIEPWAPPGAAPARAHPDGELVPRRELCRRHSAPHWTSCFSFF